MPLIIFQDVFKVSSSRCPLIAGQAWLGNIREVIERSPQTISLCVGGVSQGGYARVAVVAES